MTVDPTSGRVLPRARTDVTPAQVERGRQVARRAGALTAEIERGRHTEKRLLRQRDDLLAEAARLGVTRPELARLALTSVPNVERSIGRSRDAT